MTNLAHVVLSKLREQLFDDSLELTTVIRDTGNVDSLDMLEISLIMQDHFDIEIDDAELEKISTVSDLVKLIEVKLKNKK